MWESSKLEEGLTVFSIIWDTTDCLWYSLLIYWTVSMLNDKVRHEFLRKRKVIYLLTLWGLTRGSGRSPGGGNGNPLQCSCQGNPMDRWTEEPGRLQSLGLQRVGHDWALKHATAHWLSEISIGREHTGLRGQILPKHGCLCPLL